MLSRFIRPGEAYGKWIVSFTGFMNVLTYGQLVGWITPGLTKIAKGETDFTLSDNDIDNVIIFSAIGFFVGPFPAGFTMDRIGRRNSLLLWSIIYIVASIAMMFIKDPMSIAIIRLIIGIWGGVTSTIAPIYLGEFLNSEQRDQMFSYYIVFFMAGYLIESLTGFGNYFTVSIVCVATAALLILSLLVTPESHYYYLMKNEKKKAKDTIIWLKGSCSDQEIDDLEKIVHQQLEKSTFIEMLSNNATRSAFFNVVVLSLLQKFVGYMIFACYIFKFFPENMLPLNTDFLIYCVSLLIGAFLPKLILNRIGGVLTFRFSMILSTLSLGAFSVWFFLRDKTSINVEGTEWILYVALIVAGISVSTNTTIQAKYQGELFPVNCKAMGTSVSLGLGTITTVLITKTYSPMVHLFGYYSIFAVEAVASLLGIVFSFWMIETKGKTLEEIQSDLKKEENL